MPKKKQEEKESIGQFKTPEEVINAYNTFFENSVIKDRTTRWDKDYDLYRLKVHTPKQGYTSYTTNAAGVLAQKSINMITDANLFIHIPLEKKKKAEREQANNFEYYLYGILNINDDLCEQKAQPPTRDQMGFLSIIRGGFALLAYVGKNEDDETLPEITIWDVRDVAYEIGAKGTNWAIRKYETTRTDIVDRYPELEKKLENVKKVVVYDAWDKKTNSVVVSGSTSVHAGGSVGISWAKEPEKHGLDECPVFIIPVGAQPTITSATYTNIEAERFVSVYALNRNIYPLLHGVLSDLITIVKRGVRVPLGIWSASGKKTLPSNIWSAEQAHSVSMKTDEKVDKLMEPTMPGDTAPLINLLVGDLQRGGFSHLSLGELGFRLSGFAISQLQGAITTTMTPFVKAVERGYRLACVALLKQFVGTDLKAVEVWGETAKGQPFGYPERLKIKPSDLKKGWYPEIRLRMATPKDEAQRVQMASMLKRDRLLSDETLRDQLLDVRDPEAEQRKLDIEEARDIPLIKIEEMFWAAVRDGDFRLAQYLYNYRLLMEQKTATEARGATQPQEPTKTERESMGTPGAGIPARETGMPSEALPPESLGGLPPGAMGATIPEEATEI